MKYRICAPVLDPILVYIPIEVYADDADLSGPPLTTYPFILRASDTLESASLRLVEHCLMADTLFAHNQKYAAERAWRFDLVKEHMEGRIGSIITSEQIRAVLLGVRQ